MGLFGRKKEVLGIQLVSRKQLLRDKKLMIRLVLVPHDVELYVFKKGRVKIVYRGMYAVELSVGEGSIRDFVLEFPDYYGRIVRDFFIAVDSLGLDKICTFDGLITLKCGDKVVFPFVDNKMKPVIAVCDKNTCIEVRDINALKEKITQN